MNDGNREAELVVALRALRKTVPADDFRESLRADLCRIAVALGMTVSEPSSASVSA